MNLVRAAGIAFVTPAHRALFLRRSKNGDHAGEWCFPGGTVEKDETVEMAAMREALEETGFGPREHLQVYARMTSEGVDFTTFRQPVGAAFDPILNDESDEFVWASLRDPPRPLHPGVEYVLQTLGMDAALINVIAFDKSSVRSFDRDGRMHVSQTNISKAAINPYLGREIPDYEALGLQPDKIYRLYRDPEEVEKAAPTFNNLPLLSRHVAVTADAHAPELVIGSTGTDAEFAAPFLRNSLVIWAKGGIDAVESEAQKELSSAYRYRADMTPGVFEGQKYDGIMRDIVGNHVALVKEGRAGSDVVVGDSNEELKMSKKVLMSRTAILTLGALTACLMPKLAMDAKIDLRPAVADLTAKNFKEKRPALIAAIEKAVKGKLAQDADIGDVTEVLDALQAAPVVEAVAAATSANGGDPDNNPDLDKRDAVDASPLEKVKEFLRAKGVADDVLAELDGLMAVETAQDADPEDETPEEKKKRLALAKDEPPNFKGKPIVGKGPPPITKTAMDAAIAAAVTTATATAVKTQREIRDAERAVRPYVGELAMAHDSADEVYKTALTSLGVKVEDIHPSAFPTILAMQPKAGDAPKRERIAMDSAGASGFAKRFPNAAVVTVL